MEYNEVAAKWWADTLRNVEPNNFDNGDTSENGHKAGILALLLAASSGPTDGEAIGRFQEILAEEIKEQVEMYGRTTLYVDYGPDHILAGAARKANLQTNAWPWKTTMRISPDKVEVRKGYGAPSETIYPK